MRHFATLAIGIVAFSWMACPTQLKAQNANPNDARATGPVTFVVPVTDEDIERLKSGGSLLSAIPPEIRNRVTEVRLRYEPSQVASRTNSNIGTSSRINIPQLPSNTSNQQTPPPRSNGGFQPGSTGTPNNGINTRPLSPNNNNSTQGSSSRNALPRFSGSQSSNDSQIPRFSRSNNGLTGQQNNSNLTPISPRTGTPRLGQSQITQQYDQPVGPALPRNNGFVSPFENSQRNGQSSTPPVRSQMNVPSNQNLPNNGGYLPPLRPQQPANTGGQYQIDTNQQNNQYQTAPPVRGNEFDTTRNRSRQNQNYQPSYENPAQIAQGNMGTGYRPNQNQWPNDVASQNSHLQHSWNYSQPANRPSYVPPQHSQYAPQIATNYDQRRQASIADHNYIMEPNHQPNRSVYRSGNEPRQRDSSLTAFIPAQDQHGDEVLKENDRPNGYGPQSPISQVTQKFNGFLWFLLLCSLGLNLYLGWISRGFYVRYHELADELRDTFSATI